MKRKPIRFEDTRDIKNKSSLCTEVTMREAKIIGESSAHGKSYYKVECPFCLADFIAYKWSLRGGGKRCPNCLAIMGSTFQVFQWAEKVKNNGS
ncbi:hypothetical protein RFZ45_15320 [Acinetobacter baumannii]|nr:hypothetical protein [Acinetobacter baumannii]